MVYLGLGGTIESLSDVFVDREGADGRGVIFGVEGQQHVALESGWRLVVSAALDAQLDDDVLVGRDLFLFLFTPLDGNKIHFFFCAAYLCRDRLEWARRVLLSVCLVACRPRRHRSTSHLNNYNFNFLNWYSAFYKTGFANIPSVRRWGVQRRPPPSATSSREGESSDRPLLTCEWFENETNGPAL